MDLVIRATVVFFFIFLVTRVVGRRELSELEPFDLILLVVLGDLVQQGITQSDESVTGTLIVISTIALLSVAVSWVSFRSRRVRAAHRGRADRARPGRAPDRAQHAPRADHARGHPGGGAPSADRLGRATSAGRSSRTTGNISCIPRRD